MAQRTLGIGQPFHGWRILFLAALGQLISGSFTISLIGIYIEPLSRSFAATPGQLGWATAIFIFVGSLLSPLVGQLADKGKIREIMTLGAGLLALGFFSLALSQQLYQAALSCALLIAPGSAMLGFIAANSMLVQWFNKRRGFAIGVAAAGISLGGFLMPPIAAGLIATFDWRITTFILASFIALVAVPISWLFAVSKPSDVNQLPDGDTSHPLAENNPPPSSSINFKRILQRLDFWIIAAAMATLNFSTIMMVIFLVPYSQEKGIDAQTSAFMLSFYSGAAFLGKFVAGWLADRFRPKTILIGIIAVMALGMLPLVKVTSTTYLPIIIMTIGLAVGGMIPVWASLLSENFGAHAYGKVQGTMTLILVVFNVLPGPLGGYLYDQYGTYDNGFMLLVAVLIAGLIAAIFIPNPKIRS